MPSLRISELNVFSLNSVWITRWLALCHTAWQVSGEGCRRGIVRSRKWSVVVTCPLWHPKGHHQYTVNRGEMGARNSQPYVPLSSLYCFHASKSKSLITTWLLTTKLVLHKPVNTLSLKLTCRLKIRARISKLVRQLFFMGSPSLLHLGVPRDLYLNRGVLHFLFEKPLVGKQK